jgi:hypothetical protein
MTCLLQLGPCVVEWVDSCGHLWESQRLIILDTFAQHMYIRLDIIKHQVTDEGVGSIMILFESTPLLHGAKSWLKSNLEQLKVLFLHVIVWVYVHV